MAGGRDDSDKRRSELRLEMCSKELLGPKRKPASELSNSNQLHQLGFVLWSALREEKKETERGERREREKERESEKQSEKRARNREKQREKQRERNRERETEKT